MSPVDLSGYTDVKERLRLFYEKYPNGSVMTVRLKVVRHPDDKVRVIAKAHAYRSPEDLHPGVGHSWLELPGTSNFTRGAEAENAETSAWGRAIGSLGIGTTSGIASTDEIKSKGIDRGEGGSLIGIARVGDKNTSDYSIRQTPDGPALGFRLIGDKGGGGILVRTHDALALQLDQAREHVVDKRVTVWGSLATETFRPTGSKKDIPYQVMDATRVRVPEVGDLPVMLPDPDANYIREKEAHPSDAAMDAASGMLTEAESEAIWDEVERLGA